MKRTVHRPAVFRPFEGLAHLAFGRQTQAKDKQFILGQNLAQHQNPVRRNVVIARINKLANGE